MTTLLILLQLIVVLAMIFIGAKVGGIGLGIYGMVGVFILVFVFGLEPGNIPIENSIGIVTALNPYIGYKTSTKVAKEALETNRSVYDIVLEKGLMTQEKLDEALDPSNMLVSHKFIK